MSPSQRVVVAVLCLLVLAGAPHKYSGSGTGSVGKDTLKFEAAFATWDPQSQQLRLVLLPFTPTQEQLSWVEKFPAHDYQVVESPARPFLRLDLRLKPKARGQFQPGQVEFFNLSVWRADGTKSNVSSQAQSVLGTLKIGGDFRSGKPVQAQAQGESGKLKWSFRTDCRVFVVPAAP